MNLQILRVGAIIPIFSVQRMDATPRWGLYSDRERRAHACNLGILAQLDRGRVNIPRETSYTVDGGSFGHLAWVS